MRLYAQVGYSKNFRIAKNNEKYELIATASEIKAFVAQQKRPEDDPKDELKFYPNDGTAERPPAPGDLLIFAPAASNGYAGHVAVVDTVAGDLLEYGDIASADFTVERLCAAGMAAGAAANRPAP